MKEGQTGEPKTKRGDLNHLRWGVGQSSDDCQPVKKVNWNPVRTGDVRTANGANSPVCGQNHNGCQLALEGSVQKCETLDVQHVYFIDEKYTRYKFSYSLINVPVHYPVDFVPQFFCYFCLFGLQHLTHQREDIVPPLGVGISRIQVVETHILFPTK